MANFGFYRPSQILKKYIEDTWRLLCDDYLCRFAPFTEHIFTFTGSGDMFVFLVILTLLGTCTGDYDCACSYSVEKPVHSTVNIYALFLPLF